MRISNNDVNTNVYTNTEINCAFQMHWAVYPCDGLNSIVASSKFIPVLAMNIAFHQRAWVFNYISRNFSCIELPLNPELWLDLYSLSDHECISYFCFSRQHIHLLVSKLEFPDVIIPTIVIV
jgi:hypothetical protein